MNPREDVTRDKVSDEMRPELERLFARIAELEAALWHYANEDNWDKEDCDDTLCKVYYVAKNGWEVAAKALGEER